MSNAKTPEGLRLALAAKDRQLAKYTKSLFTWADPEARERARMRGFTLLAEYVAAKDALAEAEGRIP